MSERQPGTGDRVRFWPNPRFPDRFVEGVVQRWRGNSGGGRVGWPDVKGDDGFERSVRPSKCELIEDAAQLADRLKKEAGLP